MRLRIDVAAGEQLLRLVDLLAGRRPGRRELVRVAEAAMATADLGDALLVREDLGVLQLALHLGEGALDLCDEAFHACPQGIAAGPVAPTVAAAVGAPSDRLRTLPDMPVEHEERMLEAARTAADAWSELLGVAVTPDLVLLGTLFAVAPAQRPATEALVRRLAALAA